MKRIAYTRPDGGVSVIVPVVRSDETEDQAVARVQGKDVPPDASNAAVVDETELPDREFRDAWTQPGRSKPAVDMAKARVIHAERIEAARRAELLRLWDEEAVTGQDLSAEKQRVRDATVDLDTPSTPDDLKATWPDEVPRP